MVDNEKKKCRSQRTTKKQHEIIIHFLEDNKILLSGKVEPKEVNLLKIKWNELVGILNTCGNGPQKTLPQWKKAVQELKTNTRKRARDVYIAKQSTGGGPAEVKELTDLEVRLMGLLSKVSVEGAPIPEAGLGDEQLNAGNSVCGAENNSLIMDFPELTNLVAINPEKPQLQGISTVNLSAVSEEVEFTPQGNSNTKKDYSAKNTTAAKKGQRRNTRPEPINKNLCVLLENNYDSTAKLAVSVDKLADAIILLAKAIEKMTLAKLDTE